MEGESNGGSALKDGVSFQVTVWTPAAVSEKPRHQPTLNITQVCASKYACVWSKKRKSQLEKSKTSVTKTAVVSLFDSHLLNGDNSFALKHLTISVKKFSHFEAFLDLHGTIYLMHLNWLKIVPALHCRNYPQFMTHTIELIRNRFKLKVEFWILVESKIKIHIRMLKWCIWILVLSDTLINGARDATMTQTIQTIQTKPFKPLRNGEAHQDAHTERCFSIGSL